MPLIDGHQAFTAV